MDYSATINLPKTDFPMRAGLPQNEPKILDFWKKSDIYNEIRKSRAGRKKYILHDGPPYSNGSIHLGQSLNKILKDIAVKYRSAVGFDSPYVPGWDTHGLPNELATIKKHKLNPRTVDPVELRKKCAEHALHFLDVQREQFIRLGVFAEWDNPYRTLDASYEAAIVRTFGEMAAKGMVYRGLKPVHWCPVCETALAEAEIEYKNKKSCSVYVKFPVETRPSSLFPEYKGDLYFLIWTTTPWTLPGNVAIALNASADYTVFETGGEGYIVARSIAAEIASSIGVAEGEYKLTGSMKGSELENMAARHPMFSRDSLIINAPYVVLDDLEAAGTGCVHTAPGHGREDYESGMKYNLPILVPVDDKGCLTEEAGRFAGLYYADANEKIIEFLRDGNLLVHSTAKEHSYPHCWRCRGPVIFRATKQWFVAIDVDSFREKSLKAIDGTNFIPQWGHSRIYNMVESRPDWCISRQRVWGTPIPAVFCDDCGEVLFSSEVTDAVAALFEKQGSDSWYKKDIKEILPENFECSKCHGKSFTKEMDIFDVWFESGVSHEAVMGRRDYLNWPADLYLEGSDQHRGWFQVSLLTAMATRGLAPFKTVLTHGWVLDGKGNAMHKSLGNVIDPLDMIGKYGAEILRLFVSSVDYTADMRFSDEALVQISEVYKKIRNSCRFLIGNLFDFSPAENSMKREELLDIDRWILHRKNMLIQKMREAYEDCQFHVVYYYLQNFCATDLSAVYMDVVKDRLYTCAPDSRERRSAQMAMYETLRDLVITMSPVLSFTSEEIWQNFFVPREDIKSVFIALWPETESSSFSSEDEEKWSFYMSLRDEVYVMLEELRKEKHIKQSLEAGVKLFVLPQHYEMLLSDIEHLRSFFIVSQFTVKPLAEKNAAAKQSSIEGIFMEVGHAAGEKCCRCWNYFDEDSRDESVALCCRCNRALGRE